MADAAASAEAEAMLADVERRLSASAAVDISLPLRHYYAIFITLLKPC